MLNSILFFGLTVQLLDVHMLLKFVLMSLISDHGEWTVEEHCVSLLLLAKRIYVVLQVVLPIVENVES